jgi:Holliday junction resolvase RusA-like endonuclease
LNAPICFDLAKLPPSSNNLFATFGKRRILAPRYRDWRVAAGWEVRKQIKSADMIDGPFAFNVSFVRPNQRARDLDNMLKALLDLSKELSFIRDDSDTAELHARWITKGPAVRVQIIPCLSRG